MYVVPSLAAPVLTLKDPMASPGGVTRPTLTATLSSGHGTVWLDSQSDCASAGNNGPNVQGSANVDDDTPPYTVDIRVKERKAINADGPVTYYAVHTDGDSRNRSPCSAVPLTYVYDRSIPVLSVASAGPYYNGDLITIDAKFDNIPTGHSVQVRGFPAIDIDVGGKTCRATATKRGVNAAGDTVSFRYRVSPGD